jgi:UDP-N-acetyl-D-glucosamine dehydrogenase
MYNNTSEIEEFILRNHNKKVVVVQGLGFVGAVMSIVVANSDVEEYAVIGIDLPGKRDVIDKLNQGIFPIESTDSKVTAYFEAVIKRGNFIATDNTCVYGYADVVIIDINLDVQKESDENYELKKFSVDLGNFTKAVSSIAENCKEDLLVLVETTVPPGTCQNLIHPIFKSAFEKRGLKYGYKIAHSYERVMPGPGYIDSIKNFYRVFSGIDEKSAEAAEVFLKTIISTEQYPLTRLKNTNASEMSKVLENSFRAMNIAFIQEWTEYAEKSNVNLFEVIDAIRMRPTHKNIMKPGIGVGGYCLTKDPLLASWSAQNWFGADALNQSEMAVRINDKMPAHTYERFADLFENGVNGKSVLILGVSYLQNVGDTRYSPLELIARKLTDNKALVKLHDPFLDQWENTSYILSKDDEILSEKYDGVIIGTPHDYYIKDGFLEKILEANDHLRIVDPHGAINSTIKNKYNGKHIFRTIGIGES